jgi:glycolate oxidase FAD binding subunit
MSWSIARVEHFNEQEARAAQCIRAASESKRTLSIEGGGTRAFLGRSVASGDVLSSQPFSGVISYEPSELVLRVGAGTKVSDIQAMLAEKDQCLAFEPHVLNGCEKGMGVGSTIGGAIASAMAGSARPWQGGVKDHVLGLGLINGKGDILKFGGQVMKNVAGYDVSRAMVGSLGCMGLITEVSLKVLPTQSQQRFVQMPCSLEVALALAAKLDRSMTMRTGFAWCDDLAHIRFSGPEDAVSEVLDHFELRRYVEESDVFWDLLSQMKHPIFDVAEPSKLWRVVTPKYTRLTDVFPAAPIIVNWAGGESFIQISEDDLSKSAGNLRDLDAHVYSLNVDQCYVLGGLSPTIERLHVALKNAFDPYGVLNVGRMSEAF